VTTDEVDICLFLTIKSIAQSPDQKAPAHLPSQQRCVKQPEIPEVNVQADRVSSSLSMDVQ